jgi:hypothetical protein
MVKQKKIDNPQPSKRAKTSKTLLPAIRHSDRFFEHPLSHYEGGRDDEDEEGRDKRINVGKEAMEEEDDE